jgi:hypothetical protein
MSLGYISHQFHIAQANIVKLPATKTVWNQYDEHGLVLSLSRLDGETNWEYKRRLMDVMVHAANSTYQGMVHGITHELGLSLSEPLLINPRVDSNGKFLAPDPYIRFEGPYSDYANGLLDWAIDRYEPGGNYEHLGRLVEFINTTSFFEAHLISSADPYTRSMTLVNQSNRILVRGETVKASTRFKLDNEHIVPDSLSFTDGRTFSVEVSSPSLVLSYGQYHIDYDTSIITVASVPRSDSAIKYEYTKYPFTPIASPVIIHDITSNNFRAKMFQQVLQDDGTYEYGMPTEVGVDIINELLTVFPMYWGI